jgi:hypothetical protein
MPVNNCASARLSRHLDGSTLTPTTDEEQKTYLLEGQGQPRPMTILVLYRRELILEIPFVQPADRSQEDRIYRIWPMVLQAGPC